MNNKYQCRIYNNHNKLKQLTSNSRGWKQLVHMIIIVIYPEVGKKLNLSLFDPVATNYFGTIVRHAMKQRQTSGYKRNDLIDIFLDAMKDNNMQAAAAENTEDVDQYEKDAQFKKSSLHIADEEMESCLVASAFILFVAGFDTSSVTVSVLMLYLANNPDIQEKLYEVNVLFMELGVFICIIYCTISF